MAVKLSELYNKLYPKYNVQLCTKSCFEKSIRRIHVLEEIEFTSILRGGELILNSGFESDECLQKYIELLDLANAGGLIIALRNAQTFSPEIIDYCNKIGFPLFSAAWKTSYMDIIHFVSSVLLENEHKESNLISALKNAIYTPETPTTYQSHLEEMMFPGNSGFFIVISKSQSYDIKNSNTQTGKIKKSLQHTINGGIVFEKDGLLITLAANHQKPQIKRQLFDICKKDTSMCAGIGFLVYHTHDLHRSYKAANTAYQLAKSGLQNILDYDELGLYKILADVKDPSVCSAFAEEALGPLLKYDEENQTNYIQILRTYFENECSSIQTAKVLYFHKNTMTFKLNKIKEILGYDITKNENRAKIMMAFYIMRMEK